MAGVKIKTDSIQVENVPDGYYLIGNKDGLQSYYYLGEGAQIKKITEHFLGEDPFAELTAFEEIVWGSGGKVKTGVNIPGEYFYIEGKLNYQYSIEYLELPIAKTPPKNKQIFVRSQISQSGFTLDGAPIISGLTKGNIITESYLDTDTDKTAGTIENGYLITSVSKSNPRYINDQKYYNISIIKQEINNA